MNAGRQNAISAFRKVGAWLIFIAVFSTLFLSVSPKALASTNGHSREEAVRWINSLVDANWGSASNTINYDGSEWVPYDYGEPQCVDLIACYWDYLVNYHLGVNAKVYANTNLPDGWTYQSTPEPGDIVVWSSGQFGHIGIVISTDGSSYEYVDTNGDNNYYYDSNGYRYNTKATIRGPKDYYDRTTFIRPDFAPSTFSLDVNGLLDGNNSGNVSGYGTFDIYINGSLAGNDVSDYYNNALPAGTTYEIRDIKPLNGKSYVGLSEGARTGTLDRNIGIRLAFHTIPSDPGVAPVVSTYDGHSYYFFNRQSTWYAAKQLSESYGGHLVTITSEGENSFVKTFTGNSDLWIGATDRHGEENWSWVTGESFSYSDWGEGQPDNTASPDEGAENFAHIWGNTGKWNDNAGCVTYPFVCEIDRVNTILYHYYGTLVPKRQEKAVGQSITLLDFIPTREGYTFLGWSTVSSASEPEYQPGDTYSIDADLDLHAVWFANEYTITYDANGGTGAPETVTIEGGATTLSTATPTRAHHRFLGWAARADATQARYQPGGTYNGGTVTLYAVWERVFDNLFVLPHVLTSIEDEAFLDTGADAVFIPATVTKIGSNAFGDVAVYGYAGSYAETWAGANGKLFIPVTDGWVLADQLPQGAQVTDEKWTYRKSTTETTTSTEPSLAGWTQGDFTWQQSGSGVYEYVNFPGGFDTGHTLYNSYGKAPLTNTTSGNTKREPGASAHKSYIYWHWTFTDYVEDSNRNVSIEDAQKYGVQTGSVYRDYVFFDAFETPVSLSTEGMTTGGPRSYDGLWSTYHHPEYNLPEYASWWWYRAEVMQQPYTDYQKLFTYTRTVITDETSSTPVTEGDGISNVIHWVKYEM